jgi:hypothetical protein
VRNNLVDGGNGEIEFRDPWYLDIEGNATQHLPPLHLSGIHPTGAITKNQEVCSLIKKLPETIHDTQSVHFRPHSPVSLGIFLDGKVLIATLISAANV